MLLHGILMHWNMRYMTGLSSYFLTAYNTIAAMLRPIEMNVRMIATTDPRLSKVASAWLL